MFGKINTEDLLRKIVKLDTVEFLGICRILGIKLYKEIKVDASDDGARPKDEPEFEPRNFTEIWTDLCDKVDGLNRTRRKNLNKLVSAALRKGREKED